MLAGLAMAIAALVQASAAPAAPTPDPAEIVQRASTRLSFEQGRLSGPAADLLLREAESAQFVLLAEYVTHVDRATPELMAALFGALHDRHGFNYVAVEQDPTGMERVSTAPLRGDLDRIGDTARRYPYAITFIHDQELGMMAEVGRRSTGGWRP